MSNFPNAPDPEKSGLPAPSGNPPATPALFVKAEANLLRFPFFALKSKGLKAVTGYECKGRLARDGVVYKFTYKTSRNFDATYPGALSRSAHLAFLNLLSEQGIPLYNPISWTWRDLCRRMGIACSGRAIADLKQAILATRGVIIISDQALYSKTEGKPFCTQKEAVGLYERVVFLGADMPDGEGPADRNYLWLSQWYLDNLNALFTAPLNHELWLHLEQRSSVASRLYEFLLLNFHATPILRINYEKLATFLPIRVEKHMSQAKQQLNPPLDMLIEAKVLQSYEWQKGKNNQIQLLFIRDSHGGTPLDYDDQIEFDVAGDEDFSHVEVKEKRLPPEYLIVDEFNRQWQRSINVEPTPKEMALARELLEKHGAAKLKQLIPIVVKKLKTKWPDAKSFGSVARYMPEAELALNQQQTLVTVNSSTPLEIKVADVPQILPRPKTQTRPQIQVSSPTLTSTPTSTPTASGPQKLVFVPASSEQIERGEATTVMMAKRRQEDAEVEAQNQRLKQAYNNLPLHVRKEIEIKVAAENPSLRNHPLFLEAIRIEEMLKRGLGPSGG